MTFIQLNEDSFIINISGTLHTITRKSLNFNKILRLLRNNGSEKEIQDLLKPVPLINGIYEAYLCPHTLSIVTFHFNEEGNREIYYMKPDSFHDIREEKLKFLGVYLKITDIMADWPEYSL